MAATFGGYNPAQYMHRSAAWRDAGNSIGGAIANIPNAMRAGEAWSAERLARRNAAEDRERKLTLDAEDRDYLREEREEKRKDREGKKEAIRAQKAQIIGTVKEFDALLKEQTGGQGLGASVMETLTTSPDHEPPEQLQKRVEWVLRSAFHDGKTISPDVLQEAGALAYRINADMREDAARAALTYRGNAGGGSPAQSPVQSTMPLAPSSEEAVLPIEQEPSAPTAQQPAVPLSPSFNAVPDQSFEEVHEEWDDYKYAPADVAEAMAIKLHQQNFSPDEINYLTNFFYDTRSGEWVDIADAGQRPPHGSSSSVLAPINTAEPSAPLLTPAQNTPAASSFAPETEDGLAALSRMLDATMPLAPTQEGQSSAQSSSVSGTWSKTTRTPILSTATAAANHPNTPIHTVSSAVPSQADTAASAPPPVQTISAKPPEGFAFKLSDSARQDLREQNNRFAQEAAHYDGQISALRASGGINTKAYAFAIEQRNNYWKQMADISAKMNETVALPRPKEMSEYQREMLARKDALDAKKAAGDGNAEAKELSQMILDIQRAGSIETVQANVERMLSSIDPQTSEGRAALTEGIRALAANQSVDAQLRDGLTTTFTIMLDHGVSRTEAARLANSRSRDVTNSDISSPIVVGRNGIPQLNYSIPAMRRQFEQMLSVTGNNPAEARRTIQDDILRNAYYGTEEIKNARAQAAELLQRQQAATPSNPFTANDKNKLEELRKKLTEIPSGNMLARQYSDILEATNIEEYYLLYPHQWRVMMVTKINSVKGNERKKLINKMKRRANDLKTPEVIALVDKHKRFMSQLNTPTGQAQYLEWLFTNRYAFIGSDGQLIFNIPKPNRQRVNVGNN